jgi:NAD(P)-dependent dehydrogenase (short-subunit alcohol dehydrogenase family)
MGITLSKKVIVISGGTKGVGKAVAIEAALNGASVIIGGRDTKAAESIIHTINESGGNCQFVHTDLTNLSECKKMIEYALEEYGQIDGLYDYAGVTHAESLVDCTEEVYQSIFDINVRASVFLCKYAIISMIKNGGGSIIINGSPHAWGGEKDRVAYACSKGALLTLTEHIARHYAENGIRANYITMGWTPTEGEIELRTAQGMSVDELRALAAGFIPAGRMTEISDIVPAILFLLSDDSKMVSGANFRITGGWYI